MNSVELILFLSFLALLGVLAMISFDQLSANIAELSAKVDALIAKDATSIDPVPVQAAVDSAAVAVKAIADKIAL